MSYYSSNYYRSQYYRSQYYGRRVSTPAIRSYGIHFLARDTVSLIARGGISLSIEKEIEVCEAEKSIHFYGRPNLLVMPHVDANLKHRENIEIKQIKDISHKEREVIKLKDQQIRINKAKDIEVKE